MNFKIIRNAIFPYLFDLITENGPPLIGVEFEEIQKKLNIEPENFARIDDGRYIMIF